MLLTWFGRVLNTFFVAIYYDEVTCLNSCVEQLPQLVSPSWVSGARMKFKFGNIIVLEADCSLVTKLRQQHMFL